MISASDKGYTLGIDLGPNSLGWAVIEKDAQNAEELKTGARVFDAGLAEFEKDGKGVSRNTERREARSRRRQLDRHRRRLVHLAHTLQKMGLLPDGNLKEPISRDSIFADLDRALENPYELRAKALDTRLEKFELGRALYHLAQRRGFKSNRKSAPKKNEKPGEVKGKIGELEKKMAETGARTLGEYFSKIDPRSERIRERYTSRKMYEEEFDAIWKKQAEFYPELLTDESKNKIRRIIFFQRPLKNQSRFIGKCELEPKKRRAPWVRLEAQRFRYLQRINDLAVVDEWGNKTKEITPEMRHNLINALETQGDKEFSKIRTILGLKRTEKFNLERGGEKKIPGNRTASRLIAIFGAERWNGMSDQEKNDIINDWLGTREDNCLVKHGRANWELDETAAKKFGELTLDQGYCNFSLTALRKLLPYLEKGEPLQTAIKICYPERWEQKGIPVELLPPVDSPESGLPALRNPIVHRTLTELRRLVNAIVKRYGRPEYIRIELARDLRQMPKQREDTWKRNRANEKQRIAAKENILKENGQENPSRNDILKLLLWEECGKICPYTGKSISFASLIGDHPQFDIEHIIPFSRCLDDSYMNKTLCDAEENRKRKKNKTPYEAYFGTEQWDEIIDRIKKWPDKRGFLVKLRRFRMTPDEVGELLDDFTSRQLNDTRWASKWAKQYLGLLYGGVRDDGIDSGGKRRIRASSGPITAFLRNEWELNRILGDGPGKSRDDHRHHAVDAVTIALTDDSAVKALNDAASRAGVVGRRLFDKIPPPWEGFLEDVRKAINETVTSHRVSNRVRGALHKETIYGKIQKDQKTGKELGYVHKRTALAALTKKDIEEDKIIDPKVREIVARKLRDLGETDPGKAFKEDKNHPVRIDNNGRTIPIHKVRVKKTLGEYIEIDPTRRVRTDRNHHIAIYEVNKKGKIVWEGEVVSMYKAYQRVKAKEELIRRNPADGRKFLFSLCGGDIIELDFKDREGRGLFRIRSIESSGKIRFCSINDSRKLEDIGKIDLTAPPSSLKGRHCRKIVVTPLGEVRYANN